MPAVLDATALGYLTGLLGFIIATALVVSLTIVNALLQNVGGSARGHVPSIAASLVAVMESTNPIPQVLPEINRELEELAGVLGAVGGHLSVARRVFEANAEAR